MTNASRQGWDHALAERAWRGRPKPSGPQSWEGLEDFVPVDYARADGLERWVEAADAKLDADRKSTLNRITILDGPLRAAALDALGPDPSPFWVSLIGALVLSTWDMARRLSGMPELCVIGKRKPEGFPFANLHEALTFYEYGRPSGGIGGGAPQPAVALDRDEDLQLRQLFSAYGIDTVPCKPTHVGSRHPRGLGQLDLWLSVEAAIRGANPWDTHKAALTWLLRFHVGQQVRVPKKKRLGDVKASVYQWAPIKRTVTEIAAAAEEPEHVVREALKQVRRRVTDSLIARELIPPITKQATRSRRPRSGPPLTPEWTP
jgi:hypothetical protein